MKKTKFFPFLLLLASCTTHHYYGSVAIDQQKEEAKQETVTESPTKQLPVTLTSSVDTVVPQNSPVTKKEISLDPSLKNYKPSSLVRGKLRSIGSDSMDKMMQLWEIKFKEYHQNLRFSHEGKGSSTAIPALLEDNADIGPMIRGLKETEIAKFETKFGYKTFFSFKTVFKLK